MGRSAFRPADGTIDRHPRALAALRWWLVALDAVTIVVTWPVWQHRDVPPMLAALHLPSPHFGAILIASLALVGVRPRLGLAVHALLLLWATLADQTRLQPYMISMLLLLAGTLPTRGAAVVARAHLVAVWFFGGLNKLIGGVFAVTLAPWMLRDAFPFVPERVASWSGWIFALAEMSIGLLSLARPTRRAATMISVALHGTIVLLLARLPAAERNTAVWPWNVALASSAVAYVWPWRESAWRMLVGAPAAAKFVALVMLLAPLGWHVGLVDACFAHQLYSGHVPTATTCDGAGRCVRLQETRDISRALRVLLSPEPRLLRAYFERTCRPGDVLFIRDPRARAPATIGPVACSTRVRGPP